MPTLFPVRRYSGGFVEFAYRPAYMLVEDLSLPLHGRLAWPYRDRSTRPEVNQTGTDRLWSTARLECSLVEFCPAAAHEEGPAAGLDFGRDSDPGPGTLRIRLDR